MKQLRIGFIGNFEPPFSTENDRKWSLEKLGHIVIPFQENRTGDVELISRMKDLDLLLYSHTHGWEIPQLKEFFTFCKGENIPTVSVHLDRWAGLERESDIGKEATWFTEYQFMADFSPEAQALYKKHNLNAFYLKPGVVERDCYIDKNYGNFMYDVVFVGSKGYHKEYPFRARLVDFLHETYGDRFGHYGADGEGVARGEALNRLYAVSKVVVGDSCFGGRPNYVSDRYYETRGRGGFLIHPRVNGVDYDGVGFYPKEDLKELQNTIDYWLSHDEARENMRWRGFSRVRFHETYTQRAEEMLKIIYEN